MHLEKLRSTIYSLAPIKVPHRMSIESKPTPIVPRLQAVIAQGREFCARQALSTGGSRMWIMQARTVLGRIYGEDTDEVDLCCPRHNVDPPQITAQERIAIRLPNLDRLFALLSVPDAAVKVFIGHGRSAEWLKLRIFFTQNLGLPCDEFNIEPTAGLQTASRIETMLTSARMAFLVMTAEDQHHDGTLHARENVIHEVGLFQAKLGPKRAIVMLETGCSRFSNLDGLTTINFPSGDIMARSEDVRGVLTREHLL